MELRNVEETLHVREEVGTGSLKGSVRCVCCGLLCAGHFLGLPKNLSSSFVAKHGEQFVNYFGLINQAADKEFSGCYREKNLNLFSGNRAQNFLVVFMDSQT